MRSKKLVVALARKWKTMAGFGRRTISINRKPERAGHFVVYSSDKRRFVVPLAYLRTKIFQELLRLSEEEFGMPKDGPITLPCDAAVLEEQIEIGEVVEDDSSIPPYQTHGVQADEVQFIFSVKKLTVAISGT
ncbi:auxin-responsive protein SAUR68 [Gossypium arboreum]|nr:auxin-responsive protein SAUR68 [Gossypium arboreum]